MQLIEKFKDLRGEAKSQAGGKGKVLAQLFQAGYNVPEGFIILASAFENGCLSSAAQAQIQSNLQELRKKYKNASFAVRSSAVSEDSEQASFAGEFETVLNVSSDAEIYNAISVVYESRKSTRVQEYSKAKGMGNNHRIAIVVQILIRADISGVLFTADPISGSRAMITGNYIYGMGEALVSGEATPYTFTICRSKGTFAGPADFKQHARKLGKIAVKLEKHMGSPQDIEWAIKGNRIFLLQSRPITTLKGHNPETGEWNASHTGDYLWSNANLTEATPDIMTPLTWSLVQMLNGEAQPFKIPGGHLMAGNICGHPYINLSLLVSLYSALGTDVRQTLEKWEEVFGRVPPDVQVPLVPLKKADILATIPANIRWEIRAKRLNKQLPEFIGTNPDWCRSIKAQIDNAGTSAELAALWTERIQPYYLNCCWMLRAVMKKFQEQVFNLKPQLIDLVGSEDANALLSSFRGSSVLESLGPVIALSKLAAGEISREDYISRYGHRGPHETELSIPGPEEEPRWLDMQLQGCKSSPSDLDSLLSIQGNQREGALKRLEKKHPGKYSAILSKLEEAAKAARLRETYRSEFIRTHRIARHYALRVGELTGIKDDVFFLYVEEILNLLSGNLDALAYVDSRRKTYHMYCSLPPYPALINGRFDISSWAAAQNRSDIYDSHSSQRVQSSEIIKGFPGAAGSVEGPVRKLNSIEESHLFQPGEILVTVTTNIGWTPLFPRAAAIITDVGAPLSHAAIVARELGIPAVVGCGNASMQLKTGDRVKVDGGNGTVTLLPQE